jgi:hypothetical protein
MSAYDDVFARLTADAALMALVPAERIQRFYVRDGVDDPSIAYRRSGTIYHETVHGPSLGADVTFEITGFADSEAEIEALGDVLEQVSGLRPLSREDLGDPETQLFATILVVEILDQF